MITSLRSAFFFSLIAAVAAANAAGTVKIQPILTAHGSGAGLVDYVAYEDYANKIWAQAGITLDFLTPSILNDDSYYTLDASDPLAKLQSAGHGQSNDPLVINCFFSNTFTNYGSGILYGFGYTDKPTMAISVSAVESFSAIGRVDTFAHELGHVLGLGHYDDLYGVAGSGPFLMTSGANRLVPQSLGNVAPDGANLDRLSANEIAIVNRSRFVQAVPEPASIAALGVGVAAFCRRRKG